MCRRCTQSVESSDYVKCTMGLGVRDIYGREHIYDVRYFSSKYYNWKD